MKVAVAWRTETPKATEIAGEVSQKVGRAVMPEVDEQYHWQMISFVCVSLANLGGAAGDKNPEHNGMVVANAVIQYLWDNHQVHGERLVDGWDIGAHACRLERRIRHLEEAVNEAIEGLKQTRSWLKDKRFAEIRRGLEEAVAMSIL